MLRGFGMAKKNPHAMTMRVFLSPHLRRWIFLPHILADFHAPVILRCTRLPIRKKKPTLQSSVGGIQS